MYILWREAVYSFVYTVYICPLFGVSLHWRFPLHFCFPYTCTTIMHFTQLLLKWPSPWLSELQTFAEVRRGVCTECNETRSNPPRLSHGRARTGHTPKPDPSTLTELPKNIKWGIIPWRAKNMSTSELISGTISMAFWTPSRTCYDYRDGERLKRLVRWHAEDNNGDLPHQYEDHPRLELGRSATIEYFGHYLEFYQTNYIHYPWNYFF